MTPCFSVSNQSPRQKRTQISRATCSIRSWLTARPAWAWRRNMIGKALRIIAFGDSGKYTVMYNPEIISKAAPYETEEGCLSVLGEPRKTTRYKTVKVKFQDGSFQWKTKSYSGFTAQIIQHEIDHCNGVLI